MSAYNAPIDDMRLTLKALAGADQWAANGFDDATPDMVDAILEEAGRMARDIIAPTNWAADQEGTTLTDDGVKSAPSLAAVHTAYVEGGWGALSGDPEYGGQGLPGALAIAVSEMLASANMSYSLCPMLTSGAIEAIAAHANDELKATYLPKLLTGEWTGAMDLTESGAGSDVGALKTKAEKHDDGTYRIKGQKIYITWGDHDLSDNVIHLVLARLPGSPEGTKGISMFLVPKVLLDSDGNPATPNDVRCVGVEEKLGIHASPTCVMAFGDNDNCVGYLVGEENAGMRNMFTMMNHARLSVGLEGTAISERAYQMALNYAQERVQSAALGSAEKASVAIINHPDVRRNLMTVKAYAEATRALVYRNAWALDRSHAAATDEERAAARGEADLLTPISKGWSTDVGVEAASIALQVFGGMGFVEETGIAQLYRDCRIAPIYEGTNGIQALDLVGRKLRDASGAHWRTMLAEMTDFCDAQPDDALRVALKPYIARLEEASELLEENGHNKLIDTAAAATPFLKMWGLTIGGYLLLKQVDYLTAANENDTSAQPQMRDKEVTARFYIQSLLPQAAGLLDVIRYGADSIMSLTGDELARA